MGTLNGSIWSKCSIALTCTIRSHFQHTLNRERWARVRMNVAAHQEKEKTKMSKRKAGEERRQATDFKEAVCCPSAVVQGAAWQKNGFCEGSAWGNWNLGKVNSHFYPNQMASGRHHHVEAAVDWCRQSTLSVDITMPNSGV